MPGVTGTIYPLFDLRKHLTLDTLQYRRYTLTLVDGDITNYVISSWLTFNWTFSHSHLLPWIDEAIDGVDV